MNMMEHYAYCVIFTYIWICHMLSLITMGIKLISLYKRCKWYSSVMEDLIIDINIISLEYMAKYYLFKYWMLILKEK